MKLWTLACDNVDVVSGPAEGAGVRASTWLRVCMNVEPLQVQTARRMPQVSMPGDHITGVVDTRMCLVKYTTCP